MANNVLTLNEPTINIPTMKRVVRELVAKRRRVCMFRGPAGVGKTYAIRQAATELGALLVEVRLGQYDSVDMRGMPDIDHKTNSTRWYAPATLPFKGNPNWPTDRLIILFLDEITSAVAPVFAVCYQLLQDYRIGEHELMDNVVVCCAGNNDSDRGVVNRMPHPLNNRMLHFQIGVDVTAWCHHAAEIGLPPEGIAYHLWKKTSLDKWDPDAAEPAPTVASPRSWEAALRLFQEYWTTDPDFARLCMAASIGEGETTEFLGFVNIYSKVLTADQIIKNPRKVPLPDEESLIYATAVSVAGSMTLDNVMSLHTFLTRLDPEYVVMAWQLALRRKNEKGETVGQALYTSDEFLDLYDRYKAVFDATSSRKAA